MTTSFKTHEEVGSHPHGFSLDGLDLTILPDNPHQPERSEKIVELKKRFLPLLAEILEKDLKVEADLGVVNNTLESLEFVYGGEDRFYERFLHARNDDLDKAEKMMKQMLEVRKEILGNQLVTTATLKRNFYDAGSEEEDEAEKTLFAGIGKYWAIEYFGYSKGRFVVLTGKLKSIKPGEFIKNYSKHEIQRYYFHFVERGNILKRYANSSPLRNVETEENSKRMIEIYDLKGISMSQLHISGLRVLTSVLKLGQICFPEQLEKSYFINAPFFFSAAWSVISKVLDKSTAAKTVISRKSCQKELVELVGSEEVYNDLWNRVERKISVAAKEEETS